MVSNGKFMVMGKALWAFLFFVTSISFGQQILVDEDYTIAQLVEDVLVNSNCAETSNYRSFTGTAYDINGIGYFNTNGGRFPYAEGIILSTGKAIDAVGPNDDIKTSGPLEWPGDDDLQNITRVPQLFNASYIEFDFVPRTNSISFNFLFASEEYSEAFQCEYSDVFAFILTDSNGQATNLALLPDSNDRVSATSIRPGVPDICSPRNEDFFGGINGSNSSISMTGQTKSLTAKSVVVPGERYTIKLVISDNLDSDLDSAVFLEAGSFSIDISLGENRTVRNGNPLCVGETYTLDAKSIGAQSYRWYKDGTQLTQFNDVPSLTVAENGRYEVEVEFSPQCVSKGRIVLEFIPAPTIEEEPVDLNACVFDENDAPIVDLTSNSARILGMQNPELYQVYYFSERADAEMFENGIPEPEFYALTENQQTIYARISSGNSCYEITSFTVNIQNLDFNTTLKEEYVLCLDSNGQSIDPKPLLTTGLSANQYGFVWYKGSPMVQNVIANESGPSLVASEEGTYFVEITNLEFDCSTELSTTVITAEPPTSFEVLILSPIFSNNGIVELVVEGNSEYRYSVDNLDFSENTIFKGLEAGEHEAFVTDVYGCTVVSKPFLLVDYPRFFTPNGDGINDTWNIIGLLELDAPKITIFDRYGTLLYQFKDANDMGWDGTNQGNRVPSSDYWFKISYNNSFGEAKEFKSHFTLKR